MISSSLWQLTKDLRPYLYWAILFLFLGGMVGAMTVVALPASTASMLEALASYAREVLDRPVWQVLLFIFLNNSVKTLLVIIFGLLIGIVPALFIFINGYVIGVVAVMIAAARGTGYVVAGLLPHGIFEIPAVLLGAALGMMLGASLVARLRGRSEVPIITELRNAIRYFILGIMPLLLLAALAEVYITPLVIRAVSSVGAA